MMLPGLIRKVSCSFVAVLCFVVACFACQISFAEASGSFIPSVQRQQKVVRVGYVSVKGYEEGGPGEYKTGFGYEYFQKISYYTGWKYEYVHGSFSQLIGMLEKGEIDLLGNVSRTPARRKKMLFSSYPEGRESFYVFCKTDREDLVGTSVKNLIGKKVGVGKNTFQSKLMDDYFARLGIFVYKTELESNAAVLNALEKGTIDAAVLTDAMDIGYAPIHYIDADDYYFAVSDKRPDLLEELNDALLQIQTADPIYNLTVAKKYTFGTVGVNYLTATERKWVRNRNNVLRLGYLDDNLPYSGTDKSGALTGILKIVVDRMR